MEKFIELLKKLGFKQEVIDKLKGTEEVDQDAIVTAFLEEKAALVKNDPGFIGKLKQDAKDEGVIVATKQFKKLLNKEFGLSLTETPLNEISNEDIIKKAKEVSASATNEEAKTLQDKLITLTNENTQLKDEVVQVGLKKDAEWSGKWKQLQVDKLIDSMLDGVELIVSKETARRNLRFEIQERGYDFDFDESGKVTKIKKGDLEALKPDNSGKESVESIKERSLAEFIKQSNGSGGAGDGGAGGSGSGGAGDAGTEEIPDKLKAHLAKMKESAGIPA